MPMTTYWEPGTPAVLRYVWRQNVWVACPVMVVQDTSTLTAIYWRQGTRFKVTEDRSAPQQLLSDQTPVLVEKTWLNTDVLMLAAPGAAHCVNVMWEENQTSFRCWYVNLQEPLRRTAIGFDTMDQFLDIVISPDRSEWRWKDEDEFSEAAEIGVYSPEEAQAIRAEGERVLQMMQANQSPFCDGWEHWSPPPKWEIPTLPPNWDQL